MNSKPLVLFLFFLFPLLLFAPPADAAAILAAPDLQVIQYNFVNNKMYTPVAVKLVATVKNAGTVPSTGSILKISRRHSVLGSIIYPDFFLQVKPLAVGEQTTLVQTITDPSPCNPPFRNYDASGNPRPSFDYALEIDSTKVVAESDETNNVLSKVLLCDATSISTPTPTPTPQPPGACTKNSDCPSGRLCDVMLKSCYAPTYGARKFAGFKCTDFNGDGATSNPDMGFFGGARDSCMGSSRYSARADLDGDGCVDAVDLAFFTYAYSPGMPNAENYYCKQAGKPRDSIPYHCPDIDNSGAVNIVDLGYFGDANGKCVSTAGSNAQLAAIIKASDFDGDGCVTSRDMVILNYAFSNPSVKSPYCYGNEVVTIPVTTPTGQCRVNSDCPSGRLCDVVLKSCYAPTFGTRRFGGFKCTDFNGDGATSVVDLSFFGDKKDSCMGSSRYSARADLDGDGCVDAVDLAFFTYAFSSSKPNAENYYCQQAGKPKDSIPYHCPDVDNSGVVNVGDLGYFGDANGKCVSNAGSNAQLAAIIKASDFDGDGCVTTRDSVIFDNAFSNPSVKSPYCYGNQVVTIPPTNTPTPTPTPPVTPTPCTREAAVNAAGNGEFRLCILGNAYLGDGTRVKLWAADGSTATIELWDASGKRLSQQIARKGQTVTFPSSNAVVYVSNVGRDWAVLKFSRAAPAPDCASVADGVQVSRGIGGCVKASNGVIVKVMGVTRARSDEQPTKPIYTTTVSFQAFTPEGRALGRIFMLDVGQSASDSLGFVRVKPFSASVAVAGRAATVTFTVRALKPYAPPASELTCTEQGGTSCAVVPSCSCTGAIIPSSDTAPPLVGSMCCSGANSCRCETVPPAPVCEMVADGVLRSRGVNGCLTASNGVLVKVVGVSRDRDDNYPTKPIYRDYASFQVRSPSGQFLGSVQTLSANTGGPDSAGYVRVDVTAIQPSAASGTVSASVTFKVRALRSYTPSVPPVSSCVPGANNLVTINVNTFTQCVGTKVGSSGGFDVFVASVTASGVRIEVKDPSGRVVSMATLPNGGRLVLSGVDVTVLEFNVGSTPATTWARIKVISPSD